MSRTNKNSYLVILSNNWLSREKYYTAGKWGTDSLKNHSSKRFAENVAQNCSPRHPKTKTPYNISLTCNSPAIMEDDFHSKTAAFLSWLGGVGIQLKPKGATC